MVRLEPLARQDLPALDQLGAASRIVTRCGSSSAVVGVGVRRLGVSASASPSRPRLGVVGFVAVAVVRAAASSGATDGIRLGERLGEVAEDVGRVVELDQLVGAVERPPLALGVLGDDLGPERAGRGQRRAARRRRRR